MLSKLGIVNEGNFLTKTLYVIEVGLFNEKTVLPRHFMLLKLDIFNEGNCLTKTFLTSWYEI
jgi:hypothetical protein